MFFTRLKRGAIRTKHLIGSKISKIRQNRQVTALPSQRFRAVAISSLAAYTVAMPVLAFHPERAVAAGAEESEPPSTVQVVSTDVLSSITVTPAPESILRVASDKLEPVEIGKSQATLREEEVQRQAQLAAQQAAERQKEEEAARQHRLYLQQVAARQAAAAQVQLVSVSENESSGLNYIFQQIEQVYGPEAVQYAKDIAYHESGMRLYAVNRSSGACGVLQALPCGKMGGMDSQHQASWAIQYVKRYGTPADGYMSAWRNADAYWHAHFSW